MQGAGRSPSLLPLRGRAAAGGQALGFGVWHPEKKCGLVGHGMGADGGPGEHHLRGKTKCSAVVLLEGMKSISTCGAAKQKGITLLSACGAARKFLLSHWEIIIAGEGSKATEDSNGGSTASVTAYLQRQIICWNNVGTGYILLPTLY